jgi:hypothetical protein
LVNADQRSERAIASGERSEAQAAKERTEYLKSDAILGARKDLRHILKGNQATGKGSVSGPYRQGTGSYARRNLGGKSLNASVLTPVKGITNILSLGGISHPKLFKLNTTDEKHKANSAKVFRDAIAASKKGNEFSTAVYVYDQSEYEGMTLILPTISGTFQPLSPQKAG